MANKHIKTQEQFIAELNFKTKYCRNFRPPSFEKINTAVLEHVRGAYPSGKYILSHWKVGVTNNPLIRYGQNRDKLKAAHLKHFKCFDAESLELAELCEKHWCDSGMDRCASQELDQPDSHYVYVFMLPVSERKMKLKPVILS